MSNQHFIPFSELPIEEDIKPYSEFPTKKEIEERINRTDGYDFDDWIYEQLEGYRMWQVPRLLLIAGDEYAPEILSAVHQLAIEDVELYLHLLRIYLRHDRELMEQTIVNIIDNIRLSLDPEQAEMIPVLEAMLAGESSIKN